MFLETALKIKNKLKFPRNINKTSNKLKKFLETELKIKNKQQYIYKKYTQNIKNILKNNFWKQHEQLRKQANIQNTSTNVFGNSTKHEEQGQ